MQLLEIPHQVFVDVKYQGKDLTSRFLTGNCFVAFWPRIKVLPKVFCFLPSFCLASFLFQDPWLFLPFISFRALSCLSKNSYVCFHMCPRLAEGGPETPLPLPSGAPLASLTWLSSGWVIDDVDFGITGNLLDKSWGVAQPLSVCTSPFSSPNTQKMPVPGWCWLLSLGLLLRRLGPDVGLDEQGWQYLRTILPPLNLLWCICD